MSALDWLDRAFTLVGGLNGTFRRRAWLAGAPLAFLSVFVFYLERVEGVRSMRGALALGLCLGWWWRTHWLGRASQVALMDIDPALEVAPTPIASLSLAGVAGVALAAALLPAAMLAQVGAFGVLVGLGFALPVALFAPSWVARTAVANPPGVGAWKAAFQDGAALRGSALLVQGFLLAGTTLLFANLLALTGLLLSALQGLLGMEVAAMTSFMSFENDFAMIVVGVLACWVAEPLRAGLAVIALVHARSRRDGADLRRMVDALAEVGHSSGRARDDGSKGRVLVVLLCGLLGAQPAVAQTPVDLESPIPESALSDDAILGDDGVDESGFESGLELPELGEQDQATEQRVASILSRAEFREFSDASRESDGSAEGPSWLTRLFEAFVRWLEERDVEEASESAVNAPMSLPPAWAFVVLAGALLVAVGIFLWISRHRQERIEPNETDPHGAPLDPRELAPEAHLDEAAQLAARGLYREAFRSLYLATLVALDRRGDIDFDPARTNWHYLRQMGTSAPVAAFRTFTQLFDRKWYGEELTTAAEYEHGRALATSLTAPHGERVEPRLEPERVTP